MKPFTLILFILFGYTCDAQQLEKELVKLVITSATNNGTDVTEQHMQNKAYLLIHSVENESGIYFSNIHPGTNSSSYGKILSLKKENLPGTATGIKAEQLTFKWPYQNSYDSITGVAYVTLGLITQGSDSRFFCIIRLEDRTIEYKGYISKIDL